MNDEEAKIAAWSIAWEGCISLGKFHNSHNRQGFQLHPHIEINNTKCSLITQFLEMVKVGNIGKKHRPEGKGWKKSYAWRLYNLKDVNDFLLRIIPFLPAKQEQAALVIEFCKSRMNRPKYHCPYTEREMEIYEEVRGLNKTGGKSHN